MDKSPDLPALIGLRVSSRRTGLGLSLQELAALTGVSRAMISRIERGEVHASAVVLDKLCTGLGMALSDLFVREATPPLLRREDQPVWRDPESGYERREVAPAGGRSAVRIVEVDFPAGAEVRFEPGSRRGIGQYVWMLKGEIDVAFDGAAFNLKAGDCLQMSLETANTFRNTSRNPARYAIVQAPEARR